MAKTKKVTFNMIAADMPKQETQELKFGTDGKFVLQVKHTLGFDEAIEFVRSVAMSCVNEATGEYTPEAFDFAVKISILMEYAGVTGLDADKIDKVYRVVYETTLVNDVIDMVDQGQLNVLVRAAEERVSHKSREMANANAAKLNDLVSRMDDVMQTGQNAIDEINSDAFKEKLEQAMAAISGEEEKAEEKEEAALPSNIVILDK